MQYTAKMINIMHRIQHYKIERHSYATKIDKCEDDLKKLFMEQSSLFMAKMYHDMDIYVKYLRMCSALGYNPHAVTALINYEGDSAVIVEWMDILGSGHEKPGPHFFDVYGDDDFGTLQEVVLDTMALFNVKVKFIRLVEPLDKRGMDI